MTTLPDLDRRLSRRIETAKGIQLSPDDLDLLVSTGAYEIFRKAVVEHQREQCLQRSARSRSNSAANSLSIVARDDRISKSSGMTTTERASEALARARRISKRARRTEERQVGKECVSTGRS